MRLVIDTNCLMVSIPKSSKTRWLFEAMIAGLFEVGITTEILEEYEEIIGDFYSPTLASNVLELLPNLKNTIWVTTYYHWELMLNDVDDNKFVDCAIACQADYIVTHDKHFKILENIPFPKVRVISMDALKQLL